MAEFIVEGILMLGVSSAGVILNIIRSEFMSILILRSRVFTMSEKLIGFWKKIQFPILSLKDNNFLFADL